MAFSEKLSQLMAEKGVSNYQLAKALGVSQSSIANWKRGVKPLLIYQSALADYFDVSVDELIGEG